MGSFAYIGIAAQVSRFVLALWPQLSIPFLFFSGCSTLLELVPELLGRTTHMSTQLGLWHNKRNKRIFKDYGDLTVYLLLREDYIGQSTRFCRYCLMPFVCLVLSVDMWSTKTGIMFDINPCASEQQTQINSAYSLAWSMVESYVCAHVCFLSESELYFFCSSWVERICKGEKKMARYWTYWKFKGIFSSPSVCWVPRKGGSVLIRGILSVYTSSTQERWKTYN